MSETGIQSYVITPLRVLVMRINKTVIKSRLARETLWMLLGQGLRIIIQAFYFIVIARSLSVQGYGGFMSVVTLVAILNPFCGLGSGNILIKSVSRSSDQNVFKTSWGNCISLTITSGSVLAIIVIFCSKILLPKTIPSDLICCIAVSDLIFAKMLDISAQAFQARGRMGWTAQLNVLLSFVRMVSAVLMVALLTNPTALQWGYFYLFSTLFSSVFAVLSVCIVLAFPKFTLKGLQKVYIEGFFFSVGISAEITYNDIDKTMLARLLSLETAGIYATASRIIDVAFVPILSLVKTTYSAFFHHGAIGISQTYIYAKRLLFYCSCYSIVVGIFVFVTAPLLIPIFGNDFEASVDVIRLLAVLPLLKSFNFLMANVLTGAGKQKTRSLIQLVAALFNIALNSLFISEWSWRGAAYACITTNICLNSAFIAAIMVYIKKEKGKESSSPLLALER